MGIAKLTSGVLLIIVACTNEIFAQGDILYGFRDTMSSFDKSITAAESSYTKSEFLSAGFIDIFQNGQMNASARIFRLMIGEPGKFQLPISFYSGVTANSFSSSQNDDDVLSTLINPSAGLFNLSVDGVHKLVGNLNEMTRLYMHCHLGLRGLNFYSKLNFMTYNFINMVSGTGLTFFTGAWEKGKLGNPGVFWTNLRILYSNSPPSVMQNIFTGNVSSQLWAYSAGMGMDIQQTINFRLCWYHFWNNRDVTAFRQPILQLSVNYNVR